MGNKIDLVGQRFGRLFVIEDAVGRDNKGNVLWRCRCDCGNDKDANSESLRRGYTKSCGCLLQENARWAAVKHGFLRDDVRPPIYVCWMNMMQRCYNPNNPAYDLYGGRGIKVCEKWHSFENFAQDRGDSWFPKAHNDRLDSDGDYEPGNCRWATPRQSATENKRDVRLTRWNVLIDIPVHSARGLSWQEIADELGVSKSGVGHVLRGKTWSHFYQESPPIFTPEIDREYVAMRGEIRFGL